MQADQVPVGHIPRSMTVHVTGELTRLATPGDVITIAGVRTCGCARRGDAQPTARSWMRPSGALARVRALGPIGPQIFLPTPYTGFKAIRAGLLADTFLEAHAIEHMKKRYVDFVLTEDQAEVVNRLKNGAFDRPPPPPAVRVPVSWEPARLTRSVGRARWVTTMRHPPDPNVYTKLARSIAPEIYGHDDVKKALLLLLVGGLTRVMGDGMRIRGEDAATSPAIGPMRGGLSCGGRPRGQSHAQWANDVRAAGRGHGGGPAQATSTSA